MFYHLIVAVSIEFLDTMIDSREESAATFCVNLTGSIERAVPFSIDTFAPTDVIISADSGMFLSYRVICTKTFAEQ